MKILCVAGARPNFMKIAPLMRVFTESFEIEPYLVHTGQHYDEKMSSLFFEQLGIPAPDLNLEVGSGTHAQQTAEIMKRFEPVVLEEQPDAVLVVGDVNSTIACGLVAVKLGIQLYHVEAGLRSFDRGMPEEINRVLTDSISDLLFCTEQSGVDNLRNEGVSDDKIHLVGNVMIDTLLANRSKAEESKILEELGRAPGSYAAVTMHRPSNVDDPDVLARLLGVLEEVQQDLPIVLPLHPRTRQRLVSYGLMERVKQMPALQLTEPLSYLDFLRLTSSAAILLTDSGGIQEEAAVLGVPCLTLRENTERPSTVDCGANRIVGTDPETILHHYRELRSAQAKPGRPPLWDGQAAERIRDVILQSRTA